MVWSDVLLWIDTFSLLLFCCCCCIMVLAPSVVVVVVFREVDIRSPSAILIYTAQQRQLYIHIHPYPVHGARDSSIASNIYMNTTTTKIPVALMVNLIFSHSPSVRVSGVHCCILRSILDCHFLFLHSTIPSCHYICRFHHRKKEESTFFSYANIWFLHKKPKW